MICILARFLHCNVATSSYNGPCLCDLWCSPVKLLHSCVSIAHRHQWSHLCDEKSCSSEDIPIVVKCRLQCSNNFISETRTKDSFTKVWFDYENKTSVNKMKKNENTTATTYLQDLQARRKT